MSDVINIWDNPLGELKKEIEEKDREIAALKKQLSDAQAANLSLRASADLLALQVNDLLSTLSGHQHSLAGVINTVRSIQSKIPVV